MIRADLRSHEAGAFGGEKTERRKGIRCSLLAVTTSTESQPLESFVNGKCIRATLTNVLHIPETQQNLISIGKLADRGFEAHFTDSGLKIVRNGRVVAVGVREEGELYRLKCRVVK